MPLPSDESSYDAERVTIRLAHAGDASVLWHMLTYAASMHPGGEASIAEAQADDLLRSYVEGWMREGDLGIVAFDVDGGALGAAWIRLSEERAGPAVRKVATVQEPELAIGVVPEARGAGLGGRLLAALIERARPNYPAIVLSVREENPSVRLYERAGFVTIRHVVNRVGGSSRVMRRGL